MPTLSINLKLRRDSTKELTFEEVDGNFLELKDAIVSLNESVAGCSPATHSHAEIASMVGMVSHFATKTPPAGWLVCDGSAVSRTQYAKLFQAIQVTFGAGNGVDTFNLPDLRGEFVRGWDGGRGVDTGRTFGSKQEDSVESHEHKTDGSGGSSTHVINLGTDGGIDFFSRTANSSDAGYRAGSQTSSYGGSETRPRNVALLPCIKY